jgi:hypothetical protein
MQNEHLYNDEKIDSVYYQKMYILKNIVVSTWIHNIEMICIPNHLLL